MANETLLNQINTWHSERKHPDIIKAILAESGYQADNELVSLLARAYINEDEYTKAVELLEDISTGGAEDPFVYVRLGIALYSLGKEHEAVSYFRQAKDKGLEEIDEIPGTFVPKSVAKWLERAELWAPRRLEKNAFETQRRTARKQATPASLEGFNFEGFWKEAPYSVEQYIGRPPMEKDFAEVEAELGYRLPEAYKTLMKQQNGGLLLRNVFNNPLQRDWTVPVIGVKGMLGVDAEKPNSLLGNYGSRFWVEEWGYPDIGIAVCDCPSGGHDMIFLDYSDCGPEGEPCVVHIDQESDYEATYLADDFASFVQGLTVGGEM